MRKSKYMSPTIVRSVAIEMDAEILAGSVVDVFNEGGVETTGQEVQDMNFSDQTQFSHDWE